MNTGGSTTSYSLGITLAFYSGEQFVPLSINFKLILMPSALASLVLFYAIIATNESQTEFQKIRTSEIVQTIVTAASRNNGQINIKDLFSGLSRACFVPSSVYVQSSFSRLFGENVEIFISDEDSNKWFIGLLDSEGLHARIFSISHSQLLWNDYSSPDVERITDHEARAVCSDGISVRYDEKLSSYVFSPVIKGHD